MFEWDPVGNTAMLASCTENTFAGVFLSDIYLADRWLSRRKQWQLLQLSGLQQTIAK